MKTSNDERKHKHFVLSQAKLRRAQKLLGARTEAETIDRALDHVINQYERNRRAWAATERLLKSRVKVRDAFGRLQD
jgi:hypothetical protein